MSSGPPRGPGGHPRRRRRRRDPAAAAAMVDRFRRRSGGGVAAAGGELGPLVVAWAEVAGEVAARHSVPIRRSRSGILTVGCSSAIWAQELDMRRDELLDLLRRRVADPPLTRLRFSVADHVTAALTPPPPPPAPPAPPPVGPRDRRVGAEVARSVSDPELRALVERAAAASAARRRRGD